MPASWKFSLTTAAAVVMLAASATPALAEDPVEAVNADTEEHCDPCVVHAIGESEIKFMGVVVSECNDEVIAEIDEDGNGVVTDYVNDSAGSPCTRVMCNGVGESAGEAAWPITGAAQLDDTIAHAFFEVCTDSESNPNGTGVHCTPELEISSPADGQLVLQQEDFSCGGVITMTMRLATEPEPETTDAISLGLLRVFRPNSPQLNFAGQTMLPMTFTNRSAFRIDTGLYHSLTRFSASTHCQSKPIAGGGICTVEVNKLAAGGEEHLEIPYTQFTSSGEAKLHLIN